MRRLVELGDDPLLARVGGLLRAVEPLPESPARMQRLRAQIDARFREPPRRISRTVCWALAGCLLVGGAAAAGGIAWQQRSRSLASETAADALAAAPGGTLAPDGARGRPGVEVAPRPTGSARVIEPVTGPAASATASAASSATPASGEPGAAGTARSPVAASARVADAALVHAAVKALRREGDAEQAAQLLDRYAARDPDGPLAEEALALRIEAAVAKGDPAARRLAQDYLLRYPDGRYREAALRALAGTAAP